MEQQETKQVSRGAFSFFSGTLISRVSGLGRDMSMAFCLGSSPILAAFMVAYRFANLLRRLLGESAVSSGFVPHFESVRVEDPKQGARFFRDVFFSLFFFALFIVAIITGGLWLGIHYGQVSQDTKDILSLMMLMTPGLLFICLYALSGALLQCERKFFLPAFTPAFFNICWIATVFLYKNQIPEMAVTALSWAVVLGFFLQWILLLPSVVSYEKKFISWKEMGSFRFFPKEVRSLLRPVILGLVGISATQINSFLDALFARAASLEGPAYLWYAIRIEQLPLAFFGIALSSALLPSLSRMAAQDNQKEFFKTFRFSFSKTCLWMIPCTVALLVLASSGVNLLYGRGDFGQEATKETILCLWGYGIGVLPAVFVLLLAPAFYARKNFKVPMQGVLGAVGINIALNAIFIYGLGLGAVSVAIATSVSAWYNFFFLWKKLELVKEKIFEKEVYKATFCSILAGGIATCLGFYLLEDPSIWVLLGKEAVFTRLFTFQVLHFFALTGVFCLTFISYAWLLDLQEILVFFKIPRKTKLSQL